MAQHPEEKQAGAKHYQHGKQNTGQLDHETLAVRHVASMVHGLVPRGSESHFKLTTTINASAVRDCGGAECYAPQSSMYQVRTASAGWQYSPRAMSGK